MNCPLIKIIFIIGLAIGSASAAESSCLTQAQKEKKALPCLQLDQESIKEKAIHVGTSGTLKVFEGFVTLKKNASEDLLILAGEQTQLDKSTAVYWDEAAGEVFVLSESGDVLVYTDFLFGDVAPKRVIKNKELPGSADLATVQGSIIALNPTTSRVLFFNAEANSRALSGKRQDQAAKVWDLPSDIQFVAIAAKSDKEVYLLASGGDIYKLTSEGKAQVGSVSGAKDIYYKKDDTSENLIVITKEGNQNIALK